MSIIDVASNRKRDPHNTNVQTAVQAYKSMSRPGDQEKTSFDLSTTIPDTLKPLRQFDVIW